MIRVGITGGIGSGKSYVARRLYARGVPVYDTDASAKRLMASHPDIRRRLVQLVGEAVYGADGQLDRPLLAAYLFASADHAAAVNAIVHPVVRNDFRQWCALQTAPVVAMECAILYESGFDAEVDEVVAVCAPVEVRLRRAMERDGADEEKVRARMAAQMDDAEKCRKAAYCIQNDGQQELEIQLDRLMESLKERKE